jgi:hypothetical protein
MITAKTTVDFSILVPPNVILESKPSQLGFPPFQVIPSPGNYQAKRFGGLIGVKAADNTEKLNYSPRLFNRGRTYAKSASGVETFI